LHIADSFHSLHVLLIVLTGARPFAKLTCASYAAVLTEPGLPCKECIGSLGCARISLSPSREHTCFLCNCARILQTLCMVCMFLFCDYARRCLNLYIPYIGFFGGCARRCSPLCIPYIGSLRGYARRRLTPCITGIGSFWAVLAYPVSTSLA